MRGQAHTLEGVVAGMLVLGGVIFALQATAVTPLTASTSNQHIENQQRANAEGLLAAAEANGTLRPTVLAWNASRNSWRDAPERGHFVDGGPPTVFGASLNETFSSARIAFNVEVGYELTDGSRARERLVYMGTPTDNAVAATRTLVTFDDEPLVGSQPTVNVSSAAARGDFYAPDADGDGPLFNVLEVRIVVWRI